MNSPIQWFLLSSCDRRTAHTLRHRIVKQPQSTGPMARSSLTAALLRVIRTSSGISQSARLLHKACHWHTRIISIRSCRTIPFPSCHGIKNGPGGLPATGTIRSGKEVPTLGSYAPPCAFTITQMRCLLFESLYSIILQLLFNYLEGVAHVPRGRGRFVATCRLLDRSTTPAFTYQYTLNRTRNTGSDTVKSQQFQCFTPYGHKATKPNRQSGITVENEQPLSRSERFRGCIRISPSGDQAERIRHSSIQWPLIRLRRHRPWLRIPSRRCRTRGESDACRHAPATNWKAPSRRCCATR